MDTSVEQIIERLKLGSKAKSDTDLARKLGVSQQAISGARINNKVPDSWIRIAAEKFALSMDWLLFNVGTMSLKDKEEFFPVDAVQLDSRSSYLFDNLIKKMDWLENKLKEPGAFLTPIEMPQELSTVKECQECRVLSEKLIAINECLFKANERILEASARERNLLEEKDKLKTELDSASKEIENLKLQITKLQDDIEKMIKNGFSQVEHQTA